ncbi:hypothetical protein FSP39_002080 [Pinctada imbricata]|uniref:Ski2 N-terminal domain-containing protein n=1 Tax=Pinctada imbricata TaxID=66713 RepID=A0AA88XKK3_PINIB|nr:hypothetical protein FSP39_002080 [Pinctada imbricata]
MASMNKTLFILGYCGLRRKCMAERIQKEIGFSIGSFWGWNFCCHDLHLNFARVSIYALACNFVSKDQETMDTDGEDEDPLSRKSLPYGLPPVLPSAKEELEKYLTCIDDLPLFELNKVQKFWPRTPDPENLLHTELCPVQTTIEVERDPRTGEIIGYKEEYIEGANITGRNSLSLKRPPGPPSQDVRGSSINVPFWPGGIDEFEIDQILNKDDKKELAELNLQTDLLSVAPGMREGMSFENVQPSHGTLTPLAQDNVPSVIKLTDILSGDLDDLDLGSDDEVEEKDSIKEEVPVEVCNNVVIYIKVYC